MSARGDLGTLEAGGLIEIAALQPELEYLFRHALVQDAAYASLLKQDRRALHRAAAETILALHPDRQQALAGVIGLHFEQAGDADRAAQQYVVAGEHALERFANKEATGFFRRAIALAPESNTQLRLYAAIGGAKAGWTFADSDNEINTLEAVLTNTDTADQRMVAEAYFWLALLRRQRGEVPDTSPDLKRAMDRGLEIGLQLKDPTAAALPRALMGSYLSFMGKLHEGEVEMNEALDVIATKGDVVSVAMISDFLAMTQARLGEFEAAFATIERAKALAGDGDDIARVDVDIALSSLHLEQGEPELARTTAYECAVRAEGLGAYACVVVSNLMYGAASLARDDASSAKAPLERGEELVRLTGMAPMRTLLTAFLGSTRAMLGDMPGGIASWDKALESARGMSDRYGEAQTLWGRGRTRAIQPNSDLPVAIADLDAAVTLFEEMDAQPALARALLDRAHALRAAGKDDAGARDESRALDLGRKLGLRDAPFA